MIEHRELYNIFKEMPKPSNMHTHFSGIVNYRKLLAIIDNNIDVQKNLYYNESNNELFYFINPPKLWTKYNKSHYIKLHDFLESPSSFDKIFELGKIFYGIVRYKYFFTNYYLKAIVDHMKAHNISYMYIRSKLGSLYDINNNGRIPVSIEEELDILYPYKKYFQIIVQSSKSAKKEVIRDYFDKIINIVIKKKIEDFIIGYDLVGEEDKGNTFEYFYEVLNNLKNKYNLQYFLHAGEIMDNNKSSINMNYAIKLGAKRIGHGLYGLYKYNNIADYAVKNKILFELCPTSNFLFYKIKPNVEKIRKYINNIVVCSDDNNKQMTNLSLDFMFLFNSGLTIDELKKLLINSITSDTININEFNEIFNIWLNKYEKILMNLYKKN